ncbi:hypothetical protein WMF20_28150 [Sorangium sp. So ce834]|uniref:hypothetical protein n=1 Tax=Sorangium sp. So ce834 TaxID=3133321 RepID=UPI003F5F8F4E
MKLGSNAGMPPAPPVPAPPTPTDVEEDEDALVATDAPPPLELPDVALLPPPPVTDPP